MTKCNSRQWFLGATMVAALTLAACGGVSGEPSVTILSPGPDSTVPVGEALAVQVSASDPEGPGVFQIDLQVNGATVDTFDAGVPRDSVTTELSYVPAAEGVLTLSAVAYLSLIHI